MVININTSITCKDASEKDSTEKSNSEIFEPDHLRRSSEKDR